MRNLPTQEKDPDLLVGTDSPDDGAVYKLSDEVALVQTLDFFTPIVDDPYMFGQIAAANALSDVYAMGGKPITALNIVGFPIKKLDPTILTKILHGAAAKVKEAGANIVGGHSIDDNEPKFGLSVTGVVHPDKIFKNCGARPGDVLILTKPIGVGIQTTAIKRDKLTAEQINAVSDVMAELNKHAAESLASFSPTAVTDVTGFGLLGHAFEMANGSDVSFVIEKEKVPVLTGTEELAHAGIIPGGTKANHSWLKNNVNYADTISETEQYILCDAITSGGLLISISQSEAERFLHTLADKGVSTAAVIGHVTEKKEHSIFVK